MAMTPEEKIDLKQFIDLVVSNAILKGIKDIEKVQTINCQEIKGIKIAQDKMEQKVEHNETRSQGNENTLSNFDKMAKKSGATWGGIISGLGIALKLFWDYFHFKSGGN